MARPTAPAASASTVTPPGPRTPRGAWTRQGPGELVAAAARHPDIGDAVRASYAQRHAMARARLQRASEREGLRRDIDHAVLIDQLVGPIYHRILITGEPPAAGYGFGAPVVVAAAMLTPFSFASFAASKIAARAARRTSAELVVAVSCLALIASAVLFLFARGNQQRDQANANDAARPGDEHPHGTTA